MRLDGLRAVDSRKITHYLLAAEHPRGGSKAAYFSHFGFDIADPTTFEYALLRHPLDNDILMVEDTARGRVSVVKCSILTPDGRNPCIISVWIKQGDTAAQRFVTAYPAR